MKKVYKTEHPTIKKITIGDQFELENGTIVTFISFASYNITYCYLMSNNHLYNNTLRFSSEKDSGVFKSLTEMEKKSVKDVFPSLKFKMSLI